MLAEGIAPHDEIDRIVRLGGGLRMGPFELMDLIGIDVNFAVARSFWEQSFGEPRWRPTPIHARMVASGRLGRKTGRGFYVYEKDKPHRPRDPDVQAERPIFDEDELERLAGPNAPGVLTRLGATIANEACFALGERVASADDINTAMRLGYNWPIGSLEWGERLGWAVRSAYSRSCASSRARPIDRRRPCASAPEPARARRGRNRSRSPRPRGRRSPASSRRARRRAPARRAVP